MKLLLVDDNPTTTFYNKDILEDLKVFEQIDSCENGQEAIDYFEKVKSGDETMPDFVLLDVKMPDYDGFEVLDELEELNISNFDECKIFMLTTSEHNRDLEAFEKTRRSLEYIIKPLDPVNLMLLIKKHS